LPVNVALNPSIHTAAGVAARRQPLSIDCRVLPVAIPRNKRRNTLEWMPTFLVPLWLCAFYLSDIAAAVLGLVWIVGRALYFAGYSKAVEKRLPGFFIQSTACILLFIGAIVGIVMRAPHGFPF